MNKRFAALSNDKSGGSEQGVGVMIRTFTWLSMVTFLFFVFLGLAGIIQSRIPASPVFSMKGFAASLSSQFFLDMVGMEVPYLNRGVRTSSFSQKNVSGFVFKFLTDVNPNDPKSLMAREVPGMNKEQMIVLDETTATDDGVFPTDFTPSVEVLGPQTQVNDPEIDQSSHAAINPEQVSGNTDDRKQPIPLNLSGEKDKPVLSTNGKKVMFIYHSHNRESWLPEMKYTGTKELKDAFDPKINVTLLGKRLAMKLEDLGIGASNSEKDYPSVINKYNFNFSYKYSLKTVQEAFAANPKLEYYFDIHRDSQKRGLTTVKINGKDYAQIFLIVGLKNKNWEKNKQFADKINERLDKKYPGISRGTYNKPSNSGNAEYNQSFSPNSILIEVGGPENTLAESYRTIDALAGVISEIYWDAEKVIAPVNLTKAN